MGRRIFSHFSLFVIKRAIGTEKNKAKMYETRSLKSVLKVAKNIIRGETSFKFIVLLGVIKSKAVKRISVITRRTIKRDEKWRFFEVK